MRLRAPLNRRDSYRPPPDILEEYWRGIQEVSGSGGGFSERFRGEKGKEIVSMLLNEVREAELGLEQAEETEQAKQERAQEWLHTEAAQSDRDSEGEHFLPEISSDVLNGGRVQLVVSTASSCFPLRFIHFIE
ncbi:hypothetical protein PAMP_020153 [Pampus punctatissimus]